MSFMKRQTENVIGDSCVKINTDFHSHVLPRVDDGSRNIEESLEMLEASYAQGIRRIIATPHFYSQYQKPLEFLDRRERAAFELKAAMEKGRNEGRNFPSVLLGSEVAYFSGISRCDEIDKLCVQGTKIVLVEMPFDRWDDRVIEEILEMKSGLGVIPVIAHVDRYFKHQSPKKIENLFGEDVLIQVNAESLIDRKLRKRMLNLILGDQVDFLGSDCHDTVNRPPNLGEASETVFESLGENPINRLNEFSDFVFESTAFAL